MQTPPGWMERLVELLAPPRVREDVLGDFRERSTSGWQYFAEAVRTLPLVVWCELRRTNRLGSFLLEAITVAAALKVGSLRSVDLRMIVTGAFVAVICALLRAYRPDSRPARGVILEPSVAVAAVFAMSAAAHWVWPMPDGYLAGFIYASITLTIWWAFGHSNPRTVVLGPMLHPERFPDPFASLAVGPYVLACLAWFAISEYHAYWKGALLFALAFSVALRAYRLRKPRGISDQALQALLRRRRDAFATFWAWYLAPLVGGLVLYVAGSRIAEIVATPSRWLSIAPFTLLLLIWLWHVNKLARRSARELDQEIAEL